MHISSYWEKIVLGAVMVIAICVVVIQKNREKSNVARVDIGEN